MEIQILTRGEAPSVDSKQWQRLAQNSEYCNPFYERWMLLPALKYLQPDDDIYLVTAYKKGELIALFPVKKARLGWGLSYLTIWNHRHCFLTDPLCSQPAQLALIIDQVMRDLAVSMLRISDHSGNAYGREIAQKSVVFQSSRGAIFDAKNIQQHLLNLPRKTRLENKRIYRRFFTQTQARYITSDEDKNKRWFEAFCQLEHAGWKQKVKGSILSSTADTQFYQAVFQSPESQDKIKFQGLFNQSDALAISFRLVCGDQAFDVKTCFNEAYRSFYPGVNLELCNLQGLASQNFRCVDSCTLSNNYLINRLWPHQRKIYASVYFHGGRFSQICKRLYQLKNRGEIHPNE